MILALKLFLTPLFITAATLVGRRWGPGISGWLLGFPLTSAPVSIILALSYGVSFTARAALGTMVGIGSVCIFCLVYSLTALKFKWPICAVLSLAAFLVTTYAWNSLSLALLPSVALLLVVIALVVRFIPHREATSQAAVTPAWDIPARILIATTFVVLITTFANSLGAQLSGLLTPFPIFGLVMAVFNHRQQGAGGALRFLRGLAWGAFGFTSFFLVVSALLPILGIAWTYILATLAALVVNGVSLRLAR